MGNEEGNNRLHAKHVGVGCGRQRRGGPTNWSDGQRTEGCKATTAYAVKEGRVDGAGDEDVDLQGRKGQLEVEHAATSSHG